MSDQPWLVRPFFCYLSSVALITLLPLLFYSYMFLSSPLPSITPGPKSSMQNSAGRSSLTDQNTLFSEFSPFTQGEREAASFGPLELRRDQNTTPMSRAVRRVGEMLKVLIKEPGRTNK